MLKFLAAAAVLLYVPIIHANELIPNFHQVNESIYRSGRPRGKAMAFLAQLGVRTILSLEDYAFEPFAEGHEREQAAANNIEFINISMNSLFGPEMHELEEALIYMNEPDNLPMLVHCRKGADRTGLVIAAYRIRNDGWAIGKAKADMYNYGHSSWASWWDGILDEL